MSRLAHSVDRLSPPARTKPVSGSLQLISGSKHTPNDDSLPWFDAGRKTMAMIITALMVLRIAYLCVTPLELAPDEAYYWEWSRHLDWSYYSKPPLVAWLIAASTRIFGDSEFSIRLPAAVLGNLGLIAVYELARSIYGHRIGFRAMMAVAVTPGLTALCVMMTIDAPFLFAWTAAIYCLWRLFEPKQPDLRWLLPSILSTGAGLLSKQTSLALFPLAFLFLATSREDREKLRSTSIWTWCLGSIACLAPIALWNLNHGWVTIAHTTSHFGVQSASIALRTLWFFELWAAEFGILSPILGGLVVIVTTLLLFSCVRLHRRERFLVCFGAVPMTAVSFLSFCERVQPNWPVAFHLTGIVLVAAWSGDAFCISERVDRLRRWFNLAVASGALVSLALASLPFVIPLTPMRGTKLDLTMRLQGWRELGRCVGETLTEIPKHHDAYVVAATPRGPVSELAFYLPGHPRVYLWKESDAVESQYDLWEGPAYEKDRDALIVTPLSVPIPANLAMRFNSIQDRGTVIVPIGIERAHKFHLWRGIAFRNQPEAPSKSFAKFSTPLQSELK